MAKSFNGTTLSFGSNVVELRELSATVNGNPIDVTVLASSLHEYEVGISEIAVTAEVLGEPSIDVGDINSLAIDWNAGGTENFGNADFVVTNVEQSGSVDNEHVTSITLQPSAIAAGT